MKPLVALYLKELKENRTVPLLLLILIAAAQIYAFTQFDPIGHTPRAVVMMALGFLPLAVPVLIGPFLLAHSFTSEWRSQTNHLAFSLPVPRWWLGVAKFTAVLTLQGLLYLVSCVGALALYLTIVGDATARNNVVPPLDLWLVGTMWFSALSLLFLGLITGMEGVRFSFKRRRGYAAAGILAVIAYAFAKLLSPAIKALSFLGTYRFDSVKPDGTVYGHALELSWVAFPALTGLLLLILGLYLLHRYVEI